LIRVDVYKEGCSVIIQILKERANMHCLGESPYIGLTSTEASVLKRHYIAFLKVI